nr:hypothetical protein [Staphylococcus schweitzeri]
MQRNDTCKRPSIIRSSSDIQEGK